MWLMGKIIVLLKQLIPVPEVKSTKGYFSITLLLAFIFVAGKVQCHQEVSIPAHFSTHLRFAVWASLCDSVSMFLDGQVAVSLNVYSQEFGFRDFIYIVYSIEPTTNAHLESFAERHNIHYLLFDS